MKNDVYFLLTSTAPATTKAAATEAVEASSSKEEKKTTIAPETTTKAPETTTTAPATTAPETEPENVAGDSYWEEPVAEAPQPPETETETVPEAPQPPQEKPEDLYAVCISIISAYGYYYYGPAEYGSECWTNGVDNFVDITCGPQGILLAVSIDRQVAQSSFCTTRNEVENWLYSFPL